MNYEVFEGDGLVLAQFVEEQDAKLFLDALSDYYPDGEFDMREIAR